MVRDWHGMAGHEDGSKSDHGSDRDSQSSDAASQASAESKVVKREKRGDESRSVSAMNPLVAAFYRASSLQRTEAAEVLFGSSATDSMSGPTANSGAASGSESEMDLQRRTHSKLTEKPPSVWSVVVVLSVCLLLVAGILLALYKVTQSEQWPTSIEETKTRIKETTDYFEETIEKVKERVSRKEQLRRIGWSMKGNRVADAPVIIIPGITSISMEMWDGRECAAQVTFRERLWGGLMDGVRHFLRDTKCWMEHMSLDLLTWDDPAGIRLRPAAGFSSADFLLPNFWVWGKMLENLHDVGYEPRNMHLLTYDWRLSFHDLDSRDAFFKQLQVHVELLRCRNGGKRVALLTHSMGGLITQYFLQWAEYNLGTRWINEHLVSWINIASPSLGVCKSVSAVLSGEMRDTAEFGRFSRQMFGSLFGYDRTISFFRSLGSLPSMFPIGSAKMWHAYSGKTDDEAPLLSFETLAPDSSVLASARNETLKEAWDNVVQERIMDRAQIERLANGTSYSVSNYFDFLAEAIPRYYKQVKTHYELNGNNNSRNSWYSALHNPLPQAPQLKIYCLYGVLNSTSTEIGYHYLIDGSQNLSDSSSIFFLNPGASSERGDVKNGVIMGYGDGTVPLASLAHGCYLWKLGDGSPINRMNPANIPVTIREYLPGGPSETRNLGAAFWTEDFNTLIRGGEFAVTHVEILGNREVLRDALHILTKPLRNDHQQRDMDGDVDELNDQIQSHSFDAYLKTLDSSEQVDRVIDLFEQCKVSAPVVKDEHAPSSSDR
ncbi:Phospholipid:diacylglycerol acyltransferase [Porphyridium purpureum]|uniref:Phospholipid:diacylglycerol acyltransferase n=1 Tax=Porphyridium purpureum TaxID=35688 RepID=A0A5J4YTQ9_PORPP|nr:Phospholipid:diacylglycerol acyltransferase [Porphyridium purpureum]|eukprot:POR1334..scf227_4